MALIAAVGVARFALTLAGLPNSVVKFASMTAVILAGLVYFAVTTETHLGRLRDAYCLILPYMAVEVVALSVFWATGRGGIFHAPEYNLGFGIAQIGRAHV